MMTLRRIVDYVAAEPFRPFRVRMTSGETFEIRHPEMIAVGRTTIHVFTYVSEGNGDYKDRERELSILLIESIETLPHAKSSI